MYDFYNFYICAAARISKKCLNVSQDKSDPSPGYLSDLRSGNAEPMTKVTWLWSNEMVQFHAAAITAVFWYQC